MAGTSLPLPWLWGPSRGPRIPTAHAPALDSCGDLGRGAPAGRGGGHRNSQLCHTVTTNMGPMFSRGPEGPAPHRHRQRGAATPASATPAPRPQGLAQVGTAGSFAVL